MFPIVHLGYFLRCEVADGGILSEIRRMPVSDRGGILRKHFYYAA